MASTNNTTTCVIPDGVLVAKCDNKFYAAKNQLSSGSVCKVEYVDSSAIEANLVGKSFKCQTDGSWGEQPN